jgi:hypothetical protein
VLIGIKDKPKTWGRDKNMLSKTPESMMGLKRSCVDTLLTKFVLTNTIIVDICMSQVGPLQLNRKIQHYFWPIPVIYDVSLYVVIISGILSFAFSD